MVKIILYINFTNVVNELFLWFIYLNYLFLYYWANCKIKIFYQINIFFINNTFAQDEKLIIEKLYEVPDELNIDENLSKFLYVIDLKEKFDNDYKSKFEKAKNICEKKILKQLLGNPNLVSLFFLEIQT